MTGQIRRGPPTLRWYDGLCGEDGDQHGNRRQDQSALRGRSVRLSRDQAALLRARRTEGLDWENLAEELLSMAGRDRRELMNRLRIVLLHLLRWQAQPAKRGASWRKSLRRQRRHMRDLLQLSPSLRAQVPALARETYPDAIKDAVDETGLPPDRFPSDCPYAPNEVLAEDYLPEDEFSSQANA